VLFSYAPSFAAGYRRAATFTDKILKGARPGELPIEEPTTFEFILNLKTARTLGLSIPPSVLLRADRVLE
jgi:putative ABC transport system substrate-binding protein